MTITATEEKGRRLRLWPEARARWQRGLLHRRGWPGV